MTNTAAAIITPADLDAMAAAIVDAMTAFRAAVRADAMAPTASTRIDVYQLRMAALGAHRRYAEAIDAIAATAA